jgi:hypothetical protein
MAAAVALVEALEAFALLDGLPQVRSLQEWHARSRAAGQPVEI